MKYIVYKKLENNVGEILSIRLNDKNIVGDYLEVEDNKIPQIPELRAGIYYRGYINLDTKEITFKEFSRPLLPGEQQKKEIEELKEQLNECQQSITELTALASTLVTPTK